MKEKKWLRAVWKRRREEVSAKRKEKASLEATAVLSETVEKHRYVLSYASVADEFDTWHLNQELAESGQLLLPKVVGKHLHMFLVDNFATQLMPNSWGILEPIPVLCHEVEVAVISFVLVPALAFDRSNHRLGYGKGYYDRFLSKLSPFSFSCGIGFKEQLSPQYLPSLTTDVPLQGVLLF